MKGGEGASGSRLGWTGGFCALVAPVAEDFDSDDGGELFLLFGGLFLGFFGGLRSGIATGGLLLGLGESADGGNRNRGC